MPYVTDRFSKTRAQRGQRVAAGGCFGPHRQQERSPTRLQGPRSPCISSPSLLLHPLPRGLCSPHCSTAQVPSDFPAVFFSCLLEYLTQINRPSLDISPEPMHGLDLPPPLGLFLLGPLQTPLVLPERTLLTSEEEVGLSQAPQAPPPKLCFPASRSPGSGTVSGSVLTPVASAQETLLKGQFFFSPQNEKLEPNSLGDCF